MEGSVCDAVWLEEGRQREDKRKSPGMKATEEEGNKLPSVPQEIVVGKVYVRH